ncbi:MAG: hypothetical protein IPO90_05960 [Flavobacteriales bacterium]|nr:hypothetical protein [Flavobacteriales bacterium]
MALAFAAGFLTVVATAHHGCMITALHGTLAAFFAAVTRHACTCRPCSTTFPYYSRPYQNSRSRNNVHQKAADAEE